MPDEEGTRSYEFECDERALSGVRLPGERSGILARAMAWLRAARRRPERTLEPYDSDADDE